MEGRRVTYLGAGCVLPLFLLLAVATSVDSESSPCRVQDCPNFRAIRFYEELGCVRSDGSSECCPTRYNCSSLLSLEKTKCHYRGKAYDPGTQIQQEIKSICTPSCACLGDLDGIFSGEATFHCAHIDCPEYFGSEPVHPGCFRTYSVDQCCSTGQYCGSGTEGRQDVAECVYNGKTYLEGQHMEVPESDCLSCVCQQGFNGTLDGPWCRKFSCDFTLGHRPSELASCAPVFWRTRKCCPISWHCPSANDTLVRGSESPTENGEQCTFGDHRLNIGDELRTGSSPCVKCKCDIPPFITCTQLEDSECETQTE
ncbi:uncharacterized protein LOC126163086 [Schistocerca cancellata]|uniref:uncharacterized protein LOC126163086 n=1 Tax=Schistocerca cancellata TaxID=274614 RepID=UPI0021195BAB|nr:uncharacterized protein LOC126163086 [Schistocerca cancellata]